MSRVARMIAIVIALLAGLSAPSSAGAGQTFHKPLPPIGPATESQCQALQAEWSTLCQQISNAHSQCLRGYDGSDVKGAGSCSRAPCLALHQQMTSCGGQEQSQQVEACYAQVRDRRARDAEFRRAQEAAIQAQREAERQRQAAVEAEFRRSRDEAAQARQRADAYRQQARLPDRDETALTSWHRQQLEELRDRAAAAAGTIADGIGTARRTLAETDLSGLRDAARFVLVEEGQAALMEGLGAFERTAWIPEVHEQVQPFVEGAQWLSDVYDTFSEPARDWGESFQRLRVLSEVPFEVPHIRVISARHAIDTGGRLIDGYRSALQRLDGYLSDVAAGRAASDPFDAMGRDILGSFVPETVQWLLDPTNYSWSTEPGAVTRFFNP